jgi:hypothetical protein
MLPYSMLSLFTPLALSSEGSLEGYSVQSLSPSPHPSSPCALCVSVFSSRSSCCSGESSDPRVTLSANVDAVDAASSISPVFATFTENTGGGVPPRIRFSDVSSRPPRVQQEGAHRPTTVPAPPERFRPCRRGSPVDFQTRRHVAQTRPYPRRFSPRDELSLFLLLTGGSR